MARFLFLVLFLSSFAFALGAEKKWECPLEKDVFLKALDPIEAILASPDFACQVETRSKLKDLRNALLAFHRETLNPEPTQPKAELKKLGETLAVGMVGVLMDTERVVKGGKLCNDKTLAGNSKEALKQLVRAIYAADKKLRDTVDLGTDALKIPDSLKAIGKLINNQKKYQEARFVNEACQFLKEEKEGRCEPQTPAASLQTANRLERIQNIQSDVNSHLQQYQRLAKEQFGETRRGLLEFLKAPFRKEKGPSSTDMEAAFLEIVVPEMRICALYSALEQYPKKKGLKLPFQKPFNYAEDCKEFFCPGQELLQPDPKSEEAGKALCRFIEDYERFEGDYLAGFLATKGTNKTQFCPDILIPLPPVEDTPPAPRIRRLPPVENQEAAPPGDVHQ